MVCTVDGISDQSILPAYFVRNIIILYKTYNCVSFDARQMAAVDSDLIASITDHCNTSGDKHHANLQWECDAYKIFVSDVLDNINII